MMSDCLNNFFEHFGTVQNEKTYPKETALESIVIDVAERWDNAIPNPDTGCFLISPPRPNWKNRYWIIW